MRQLTYAEIEKLQFILRKYMFDTCTTYSKENTSLQNKLIAMRAELEYPHNSIDLSPEDVVNTI